MAETIRGINVVIGAETTGLSAALSDVNKKARDIQSELKQVERLLKLDPSNTELLAQKQKLLSDAVQNTRDKLNSLKNVQEQVNQQFSRGEISEGQYRAFQREVVKTEQELAKLEKQLSEITGEVKNQGEQVSQLGKDYQEAFDRAKESMGNSFDQMKRIGAGITAAGAAIAAGLGVAVKGAADFEQGMANVYSVMAPDEVAQFKDELKQLALVMGADTKYSATEAARGIEELVKAGVSVQDILEGGLSGALSLATAGELELADAAEIASTALNAFREDGITVQKAADILAGAANASATSVQELKFGLGQVSAVASGVGLSFEDTTTALAVFAQNGLKGSDAGTSLKTMLMNLQPSTEKAATAMADLGLITEDGTNAFIDANGQFKSLAEIAGILQKSLKGLTDAQRLAALEAIFGSDAIRAANILYKEGAEGINAMAEAMGKISAADVAAQKMNTFKGTLEELSGSFETALISIGTALIPALQVLANVIQLVVDAFNSLPPGIQSTIAIIGALTATLALITGPLLLLIGFLPQIAAGFSMLAAILPTVGAAFTALTGPVGLAIAAIAAGAALIIANWEPIKGFFTTLWDGITSYLKGVWDGLRTAITEAFQRMLEAVRPILDGYKTFFSGVWDAIKNIFAGALLLIVDLVTGDFKSLSRDAQAIWNNLKDAFFRVWEGIKQIFSGALSVLKSSFSSAWSTIRSTADSIWSSMRSGIESAINWIRSLPATMIQLGKEIIQGLIDGIKSMIGEVGRAVKSIADKVTGGLRDFLDIHSPSRVMMQLGEYTGEGFAEGIARSISAVRQKTAEMAAAASNAMTGMNAPAVAVQGGGGVESRILNFEGMFAGANFYVRNDDDIRKLARELFNLQRTAMRGKGIST